MSPKSFWDSTRAALKSTHPQNRLTPTRRHCTRVQVKRCWGLVVLQRVSLRLDHGLRLGSHALLVLNFTRRGPTSLAGQIRGAIRRPRRGYRQYHKQHKQVVIFSQRVPDFVGSPGKSGVQ